MKTFIPCFHPILFITLASVILPAIGLAQEINDSCFTSVNVGVTFASSPNLANAVDADCLHWDGNVWTGQWPNADVDLAPPCNGVDRAIWMGDETLWTTGGEGFAAKLSQPLVTGITYSFTFTYVSDGIFSYGNFAPYFKTGNNNNYNAAYSVGSLSAAGFNWETNTFTFTAAAAQNGHKWIFIHSNTGSGMVLNQCDRFSELDLGNDTSICFGASIFLTADSGFSSYSWSSGDTTATILVDTAGTYIVNAAITTCVVSDTIIVSNIPCNPPVAGFTFSNTTSCSLTCFDFIDQSTGNPTSWSWSFPGGNPSSSALQNPTNICYSVSGNYDVILIISNVNGSDTIVMTNFITVNTAPAANITQSNDTLYSSAATSYQWYTGGNPISGATDDFYVPSTEDFYSVVITDANGCTAADTIFFSLSPQTNFAASDTTICQKFCMDFFDQSGNNPTTWQWSFPGGVPSSSNQQNPTQICYNNPGVYDVTLITTNSFGSDTLVLTGYITVYSTPAFPTITVTGDILTSSYASSYQWQLNSVDIPGATNQSYTATQTGYYTVIITDENGCVSSTTVFVEVTGVESVDGDFGFSVYPNPSNGNFTIQFSEPAFSELISIEVINALGQKIFFIDKASLFHFDNKIDFRISTNGIYFLELTTDQLLFKRKIIVSNE